MENFRKKIRHKASDAFKGIRCLNRKKLILFGLIFCLMVNFIFVVINIPKAKGEGGDTPDADETDFIGPPASSGSLAIKVVDDLVKNAIDSFKKVFKTEEEKKRIKTKVASRALNTVLRSALNKIAYNTATWLGSGGKGQKPVFITEGWGEYLTNIADEAAGEFIERIGKDWNFNLCEPDLALKIKIGLGLKQYARPGKPACTLSKMKKNWEKELRNPNFLSKFQDMFEPTSNDLGIALSLQAEVVEEIKTKADVKTKNREEGRGWLEFGTVSNRREATPRSAEDIQHQQLDLYTEGMGAWTGDAVVDALNVFLNQLAITAFNKLMASLAKDKDTTTHPYEGDYGLSDPESEGDTGGTAAVNELAGQLLKPNFTVRGDYDILAELSMCPDPTKAGPTNCVISDKFTQAVQERLIVGEAMNSGYLNANGVFGFNADGTEPDFNTAYPYRSMIILRKFRILPVGWEVAAQYIKVNNGVDKNGDGEKDALNLGDLVACFKSDDDYPGYSASWCEGLVDPTWVLKAPLNYCKRAGPGPELVSEQITGEGKDSKLAIARNTDYCADEQSCIMENDDGSCGAYGYCTEERRTWNFSAKSCDAKYNTCQTFETRDGKTASYLENTLDYNGCSIDTVGCKVYSTNGSYNNDDSSVTWSDEEDDLMYFGKNAEDCDEDDEGCHEFIRTKSGEGANLLVNSSFEDDPAGTIWAGAGIQVDNGYDGAKGLQIDGGLNKEIAVGPNDYVVGGSAFTFSFFAKNCGAGGRAELGDNTTPLAAADDWNYYQVSYIYPREILGNRVRIAITGVDDTCVIDAVKLEFGQTAAAYSGYGQAGTIYEKFMPDYLAGACYENPGTDYRLKSGAPTECSNFARECNADEAGCELYTSEADGISVPAKVSAQDYCPAECDGYDTYIQTGTAFDSSRPAYFIPATARSCNAEAAGCDEFTNLDTATAGGEAIEYYSYFRQCVKPSAADANCSEFYSWEGSDETGYQLRVFNLQAAGTGLAAEPALTEDDASACSETIYNLEPSNPSYNADCRQFYNRSGGISYHLYKNTITCSEDCHPYRRTALNIDSGINSAADCAGADKHWDSANEECVICKSGGRWESQSGICAYNGIAAESVSCSAADNGCREYSGNTGNNMMIVLNDDFRGSKQGWTGVGGTTVDLSNEALRAGDNSLFVSGGNHAASTTLGNLVQSGKSYTLSFVAKSAGAGGELEAKIANAAGESADFGSAQLNGIWQFYKINLANLNHQASASEDLIIAGSADFYLDDIKLTEITDRYYLIKNSWTTPDSCNRDSDGNAYPLYMLGCAKYADRADKTHYLHSFSQLCQDSAVGCELLIDTKNSSDYRETTEAKLPSGSLASDEYVYAVYDENKLCNAEDKGCQRLGKQYSYEDSILYSDVYLKNDTDKYESILCSEDAVGCEEWQAEDGASYFKDPGDYVCQWQQAAGAGSSGWNWYKKKIEKCDADLNGEIDIGENKACLADKDCGKDASGQQIKCVMESADIACPTDIYQWKPPKTFGFGGDKTEQPTAKDSVNWAGICPASEAGCAEYIDPVSRPAVDLIISNSVSTLPCVLDIKIEPYTLYALEGDGSIDECEDVRLLGNDNKLGAAGSSLSVSAGSTIRFYAADDVNCKVSVSNCSKPSIKLRKAMVDYQLKQNIDAKSCNGLVDFEKGCVLFNERAQNGSSLAGLTYDADLTKDDGNGKPPQAGSANNANKLLKVVPDRTCDKWLACREKRQSGEESVCLGIGICNKFDDNAECARFIDKPVIGEELKNQIYPSVGDIGNMSGYVKVGHSLATDTNFGTDVAPYYNDYYQFGRMETTGGGANVPNWGFEDAREADFVSYSETGAPQTPPDYGDPDIPYIGWDCDKDKNLEYVCETIDDPVEAQDENVCYKKENGNCYVYAPEGRSFLKLMSKGDEVYSVSTTPGYEISVAKNQNYTLTAYINTTKITDGKPRISIIGFKESVDLDTQNRLLSETGTITSYDITVSSGWKLITFPFTTGLNTIAIKIKLSFTAGAVGDYYIDNVKIKPMLQSRNNWKTLQSCRLYPDEDSLACEYSDEAGMRRKGQYGYCLEYDRYPGSSDACLLWWPIPDGADRVNEFCGNGSPDGEEDCDCGKDAAGNPLYDCFSGMLPSGDTTTYPTTPNPYGTHKNNQYRCVNCVWTEGWCGDDIAQSTGHSEHCDWNDADASKPNLKQQTCWSDHSTLGDHYAEPYAEPPKEHDVTNDFSHDGYGDYLYGKLACYNNSKQQNRCRFKTGVLESLVSDPTDRTSTTTPGYCSDWLVNGAHTRKQCLDAHGVVARENPTVADTSSGEGIEVTDSAGNILNRDNVGNNYVYFCKFNSSSCGSWARYKNWSITESKHYSDKDGCGDVGECDTGKHSTFSNTETEYCSYDTDCIFGGVSGGGYATVIVVGCY